MTVYCEDPHDNWHAGILTGGAQDHTGRAQFWLAALAALAVFWSTVGLAAYFFL